MMRHLFLLARTSKWGIVGSTSKEQITIMYVPAATFGSFSIMNELTGNYWRNYKGAAFKILRASPCSLEISWPNSH